MRTTHLIILFLFNTFAFAQADDSQVDSSRVYYERILSNATDKSYTEFYDISFILGHKVLKYAESQQDYELMCNVYSLFAENYYYLNDSSSSNLYINRSEQLAKTHSINSSIAKNYRIRGVSLERNNLVKSEYYLQEARAYISTKDSFEYVHLYNDLGYFYASIKQCDTAITYLDIADKIATKYSDKAALIYTKLNRSYCAAIRKDLETCETYILECIPLLEQTTDQLARTQVLENLLELKYDQNDYKAIYEIKDSLNALYRITYAKNIELSKQEMANKIRIEEHKKVIDVLKQKETLQYEKIELYNDLFYVGLVAIIAIIIAFTFLYKHFKQRKHNLYLVKRKNEELEKATLYAEKLSKLKSQFISNVTHELRTPLYAISGYSKILKEKNNSKSLSAYIDSIEYSTTYLTELINGILEFNKYQNPSTDDLNPKFWDIRAFINRIVLTFQVLTYGKENRLIFEISDKIPSQVEFDHIKLQQILYNLLMNANKFTSNGNIYLKINDLNIDESSKTCLLSFQIEDDGEGIEKDDQEIIFNAYTQASSNYNHTEGFGLGLSIVSKILKQMGSEIKVESIPGEGSIFFFTIETDYKEEASLSTRELKGYPADYFKGKSCLIVDDNTVNLHITKWHLETYGMQCTTTTSGEESIDILKNNSYNLILMDIHMPTLSGPDTVKIIKKTDKKTPIIALSAVDVNELEVDITQLGFETLITKPFNTEDFLNVIDQSILPDVG